MFIQDFCSWEKCYKGVDNIAQCEYLEIWQDGVKTLQGIQSMSPRVPSETLCDKLPNKAAKGGKEIQLGNAEPKSGRFNLCQLREKKSCLIGCW